MFILQKQFPYLPKIIIITLLRLDFRALADSTSGCSTNFYKDGNDCKECPAGYYSDNCTDVCPAPLYGLLCGQTCDCLSCHHIYGCSSTLPIDGKIILVHVKVSNIR